MQLQNTPIVKAEFETETVTTYKKKKLLGLTWYVKVSSKELSRQLCINVKGNQVDKVVVNGIEYLPKN